MSTVKSLLGALALTATALATSSAWAQTHEPKPISLAELARLVGEALPPIIGDNNTDLVKKLSAAKLGAPLSKSFSLTKAQQAAFGRQRPNGAPDCSRLITSAGDLDVGSCVQTRGESGGTGAFAMLSFSKNLGVGNIKLLKRPAETELSPDKLKPVEISDAKAFETAVKFVSDSLGLPATEIPTPSPTAGRYPVRSLAMGYGDEKALGQVVIKKVVNLRRGLAIDPITDPKSGRSIDRVLAPGHATVVLDDSGVQQVSVVDWRELVPNPKLDPAQAKTRDQLVKEISEDLFNEGIQEVSKLAILIGMRGGLPNPDDPDSPTCPACVFMAPSVVVAISQVAKDTGPVAGSSSSGVVKEYNLVGVSRGQVAER